MGKNGAAHYSQRDFSSNIPKKFYLLTKSPFEKTKLAT